MDNSDATALEMLKLARELVINEHIDRRAHVHNQWLFESENLFRTRRLKLPYPPIPPYPTEAQIIARAQSLMDFLNSHKNPSVLASGVPVSVAPDMYANTINPSLASAEEISLQTQALQPTLEPTEIAVASNQPLSDAVASETLEKPTTPVPTPDAALVAPAPANDPVAAVAKIFQTTPLVTETETPVAASVVPAPANDPIAAVAKIFQPAPLRPDTETPVAALDVAPAPANDPVAAVAKIFQSTSPAPEAALPLAASPASPQAAIAKIFQAPGVVVPESGQLPAERPATVADIFSPVSVLKVPDGIAPQTTSNDQTSAVPQQDNIIAMPNAVNPYNNNVMELLSQQSERSNKLLPAMLKKIEDIRSGWNTNPTAV